MWCWKIICHRGGWIFFFFSFICFIKCVSEIKGFFFFFLFAIFRRLLNTLCDYLIAFGGQLTPEAKVTVSCCTTLSSTWHLFIFPLSVCSSDTNKHRQWETKGSQSRREARQAQCWLINKQRFKADRTLAHSTTNPPSQITSLRYFKKHIKHID